MTSRVGLPGVSGSRDDTSVRYPRILIITIGPQPEAVLSTLLEDQEYQVASLDGRLVDLISLARDQPDIILLDLRAPGDADQHDLCRRLRAMGFHGPIIMLAEHRTAADVVAGLCSGADDYLVKPVAAQELVARLTALRRRALWRTRPRRPDDAAVI